MVNKKKTDSKKIKINKYLIAGLIITGIVIIIGIISAFATPYSTTEMSAAEKFAAPSLRHIMGTDNFGRDIFSRVMKGIGTTVLISTLVILFSGTAGIIIGAFTGYFGGIIDEIVMRITDALNSLLGSGKQNVILSLGIVFIPSFVRIVRGEFIRLRDSEYVKNARLMGVGTLRIMFVHILPNIMPTFIVSVIVGINNTILAESGMSYLGIGVQPPDASLGKMLSDAQGYLFNAPWYALAPGITIVIIVLGVSLIGDGVRK